MVMTNSILGRLLGDWYQTIGTGHTAYESMPHERGRNKVHWFTARLFIV